MSQICTAVGANQQSSKAVTWLKCMFSESCLHCYQMRLPHTNQINQQLPIFINLHQSSRSSAHIDFNRTASSLCKQRRRSQSPAEPVPNREPDPANEHPLKSLPAALWSSLRSIGTMVHKGTLIQVYFKWVSSISSWITKVSDALQYPFLSQFQIPRTLNCSEGTKNDTGLPALLILLDELEAFQQCHGN